MNNIVVWVLLKAIQGTVSGWNKTQWQSAIESKVVSEAEKKIVKYFSDSYDSIQRKLKDAVPGLTKNDYSILSDCLADFHTDSNDIISYCGDANAFTNSIMSHNPKIRELPEEQNLRIRQAVYVVSDMLFKKAYEAPSFIGDLTKTVGMNKITIQSHSLRISDLESSLKMKGQADEKQWNDAREKALTKYFKYLRIQCSSINFNGMRADGHTARKNVPLNEIYVPLDFTPVIFGSDDNDSFHRLSDLGDMPFPSFTRRGSHFPPSDLIDKKSIFSDFAYSDEDLHTLKIISSTIATPNRFRSIVIGSPGAGKSTFLKCIVMELINNQMSITGRTMFPIYIKCRNYSFSENITVMDMIHRIPSFAEFSISKDELDNKAFMDIINQNLSDGRAVLLIDGFDEIIDLGARQRFAEQLIVFLKQYPTVSCIMTSRKVGYRDQALSFIDTLNVFEIKDLSHQAIKKLCENWYKNVRKEDNASKEADTISEIILKNDRILRLAKNPLLLTVLLLVRMRIGRLPTKRAALYEECIKLLLETWNVESHAPIELDDAKCQLSYLALYMVRKGVQSITISELKTVLIEARKTIDELFVQPHIDTVKDFVTSVEFRSSLLIRMGEVDGEALYEFQHLTFQEYLAAYAIAKGYYNDTDGNETPVTILHDQYFTNDTWQQVVLLSCAMMTDKLSRQVVADIVDDILTYNAEDTLSNSNTGNTRLKSESLLADLLLDEVQIKPELRTRVYDYIFEYSRDPFTINTLEKFNNSKYRDELYVYMAKSFKSNVESRPAFLWNFTTYVYFYNNEMFTSIVNTSPEKISGEAKEDFWLAIGCLDTLVFYEKLNEKKAQIASKTNEIIKACESNLDSDDLNLFYYSFYTIKSIMVNLLSQKIPLHYCSNILLNKLIEKDKEYGEYTGIARPCWIWYSFDIKRSNVGMFQADKDIDVDYLKKMLKHADSYHKTPYFVALLLADSKTLSDELYRNPAVWINIAKGMPSYNAPEYYCQFLDSIVSEIDDVGLIYKLKESLILYTKPYDKLSYNLYHRYFELSCNKTVPKIVYGDYIKPNSHETLLVLNDFINSTLEILVLINAEIYARYGAVFKEQYIQDYLSTRDWYVPRIEYDFFDCNKLNNFEANNTNILNLEIELRKKFMLEHQGVWKYSRENGEDVIIDIKEHYMFITERIEEKESKTEDIPFTVYRNGLGLFLIGYKDYIFHRIMFDDNNTIRHFQGKDFFLINYPSR